MNQQKILTVAVTMILGLGIGFFGGMKYQESKAPQFTRGNFNPGSGPNGGTNMGRGTSSGRGGGNFRPVSGEIISSDNKSITVKLTDGSSKIILLSSSTTISKSDIATATDLKVGEKVAVFGTEDSTGSVTAQNIQLNPIMRLDESQKPQSSSGAAGKMPN